MLPDRAGPATLLAIAAAVGLPPGLAFGARVVGLEATFEAGDFLGLIGIAASAAWVVSMVAAARAIGLPAGRGHPSSETFPRASMAVAALILVAGPALPLVTSALALPAQAEVMPATAGSIGGSLVSIITVQAELPALYLFAPLLLIGAIAYGISGSLGAKGHSRPPLFAMPAAGAFERARRAVRSATVPEQYRSILNPQSLERAAAGGRPIMWVAAVVALAYAVTR